MTTTVVTVSFSCFIIYSVMWFMMTLCIHVILVCYLKIILYKNFQVMASCLMGSSSTQQLPQAPTAYYIRHCVNYDDGESWTCSPDQFFQLLSTPGAIKLKRSLPLFNLSGSRRLFSIFLFSLPPFNRNKSNWQSAGLLFFKLFFYTVTILKYIQHCVCVLINYKTTRMCGGNFKFLCFLAGVVKKLKNVNKLRNWN